MLSLIVDLHTNVKAKVRWADGRYSEAFDLSQGLKQGAVFSPCLFALFFNCVTSAVKAKFKAENLGVDAVVTRLGSYNHSATPPTSVSRVRLQQGEGANWSTIVLSCIEYADDVVLTALSAADLQFMVTIFGEVCEDFGLSMSIDKTKVMRVEHVQTRSKANPVAAPPGPSAEATDGATSTDSDEEDEWEDDEDDEDEEPAPAPGPKSPDLVITYKGKRLDQVSRFCYLGHTLNCKGTLRDELAIRCAMMRRAFAKFEANVFCNPHVSTATKLETFNAVVIPNGFYACELWWSMTKADAKKLDAVVFFLLKRIMNFRLSAPYVSRITIVEKAAKFGVIIIPAVPRVRLGMLRYMGHVARRETYQSEGPNPQRSPHSDLMSSNTTYFAAGPSPTTGEATPPARLALGTGPATRPKSFAPTGVATALDDSGIPADAWQAEVRKARKKHWKNFTESTVRPRLMRAWCEEVVKEKVKRDAQRAPKAAQKAETARLAAEAEQARVDSGGKHRRRCDICRATYSESLGTDEQLMCCNPRNAKGQQCGAVCHKACAGLKDVPIAMASALWFCAECTPAPWRPEPVEVGDDDATVEEPSDSLPFRYHTAADDTIRYENILTLWAAITKESEKAAELAAKFAEAAEVAAIARAEQQAKDEAAAIVAAETARRWALATARTQQRAREARLSQRRRLGTTTAEDGSRPQGSPPSAASAPSTAPSAEAAVTPADKPAPLPADASAPPKPPPGGVKRKAPEPKAKGWRQRAQADRKALRGGDLQKRLYDSIPLMPTPITVMKIAKQLNVDVFLARKVVAQFSLEGLLISCTTTDIADAAPAGQGADGPVAPAEAVDVAPAPAPAGREPDPPPAAATDDHDDRAAKRPRASDTPLATRAQRDIAGASDDMERESDEHESSPPSPVHDADDIGVEDSGERTAAAAPVLFPPVFDNTQDPIAMQLGTSQLGEDADAADERGSKRPADDAAGDDDDGGFAIGLDDDVATGAASDAPGPGAQPGGSSKKKKKRRGASRDTIHAFHERTRGGSPQEEDAECPTEDMKGGPA
jgi:ribosomal protein L12E/L44/L45/RPP1/RPP2